MAIYVYNTTTGELVSFCPDDADPVAPDDLLAAAGLTAVKGLPPLGDTVAWDPVNKTTMTVTPTLLPQIIPTGAWILRFTPAEFQAIMASTDATVEQFLYALNHTTEIDLATTTIINGVNYLVSVNLLTAARQPTIMAAPATSAGP